MQAAWYPRLEPLCVFSWISRSNCRPAELESAHAEWNDSRDRNGRKSIRGVELGNSISQHVLIVCVMDFSLLVPLQSRCSRCQPLACLLTPFRDVLSRGISGVGTAKSASASSVCKASLDGENVRSVQRLGLAE